MSLDPIERILALTLDVSRYMRKRMCDPLESNKGPSMLQLHALIVIREHDGITMKQFAEGLQITGPTATTFVERLVRLGWVKRQRDRENRRLVRLKLTAAGVAIIRRMLEHRRKVMARVLSQLPERDQREFVRILEDLLGVIQKDA
jgi:MarR family transcriptional regulator, organic hydroperoxide resistance regulator